MWQKGLLIECNTFFIDLFNLIIITDQFLNFLLSLDLSQILLILSFNIHFITNDTNYSKTIHNIN